MDHHRLSRNHDWISMIIMDYHGLAWIIMDHLGLSARGSKFLVRWGALTLKPHGLSLDIIELRLNFNDYHGLSSIICSISKVLVCWGALNVEHPGLSFIIMDDLLTTTTTTITSTATTTPTTTCIIMDSHGLSSSLIFFCGLPWSIMDYDGSSSAQGSKFLACGRALKTKPHGLS